MGNHQIITVFIFLLYSFLHGNAQTTIDSLQTRLENVPKNSSEHIQILNELGHEYWIIDSKESLKYGNTALQLSEKQNFKEGKAKAHRVLGVAFWTLGDARNALVNLNEAETIFQHLNDEEGVANCLLNIGMVYADIGENKKALQFYEKTLVKFTALNKTGRIATTYTKMGSVFLEEKKYEEALNYFTNALTIHTKNNFDYGISEAHNRLGTLYVELYNLEQADYHIRQSLIYGKKVHDQDGLISNLIQYGKIWRHKKEWKTAEDHVKLALHKAQDKQRKHYILAAFDELKELKRVQGQMDSAFYFYDAYISLKDSVYSTQKSKQIAALEFNNELRDKDMQLQLLDEKKRNSTRTNWILFAGLWLVLLLGFYLIKSLILRNKNQKEILSSQVIRAKTSFENQQLKQTKLEQELEFKNKELTSYALNFVQKNDVFLKIQEIINEAKNAPPSVQGKVLKDIDKIVSQYKNIDKDWEDFKIHFERVHMDFLKTLQERYPVLSSNDIKIAALTRLNLSIKETAGILGISPESVKTARYRLRKKLNLSQEAELYSFLLQIGKN